MKKNVKDTTKALYTMCICLIVVMGILFLGNSLTKGTYSAAVTPELDPSSPSSSSSSPSSSTKCGAGKYFSTSRNKCVTCTAGYYCEGGTTGQKICPKGSYCQAGSTKPESCGTGMTTTTEGMDSKSDCVAISTAVSCPNGGEYWSSSRNKCVTCTAGYYCPKNQDNQVICPKGSYCQAGSTKPESCGTGMTTTTTGMDEKSDCVAGETVYKITLMRAEGNDTMTTCDTGTDGKITSCKKSPDSICGTWTTEPLKNNTQGGTEITSGALMSKVFTSDVTYYCKAGTSIHPENPSNPSNPSKPSNPSNPSSTPSTSSNPPSSSTVTENPKTGSVAIFMVWVIAIGTLIYSIAYFKQSKFE